MGGATTNAAVPVRTAAVLIDNKRRYPHGASPPRAERAELSVLHLCEVAGHVQENPYQVEHAFHQQLQMLLVAFERL